MGLGRIWGGVGLGLGFVSSASSFLLWRVGWNSVHPAGRKGGGGIKGERERERESEPWELRTGLDRRRLSTGLLVSSFL